MTGDRIITSAVFILRRTTRLRLNLQRTGETGNMEKKQPTLQADGSINLGGRSALIKLGNLNSKDFLFQSRIGTNRHKSTRQYSRSFHGWVEKLGLEASLYSTYSIRRTKAYLIYKKTKNLRVCQLLLGHKKLESTVRYLAIEVDDALEISESIEV